MCSCTLQIRSYVHHVTFYQLVMLLHSLQSCSCYRTSTAGTAHPLAIYSRKLEGQTSEHSPIWHNKTNNIYIPFQQNSVFSVCKSFLDYNLKFVRNNKRFSNFSFKQRLLWQPQSALLCLKLSANGGQGQLQGVVHKMKFLTNKLILCAKLSEKLLLVVSDCQKP